MFDQNPNNQSGVGFSGNPPVSPKVGRDLPGTEDIFADTDQTAAAPKFVGSAPAVAEPVVMPELGRAGSLPPELKIRPKMADISSNIGPVEPLSKLPDDLEERPGGHKFLGIGVAIAVVVLGVGGYFAYSEFFASSTLKAPTLNLNILTPGELNQKYQGEVANLNLAGNANQNANVNVNDNANAGTTTVEFPCPQPAPTAPDFCSDGKIVSGGVDEHGCQLAPTCQRADTALDSDGDGLTNVEEQALGTNPNSADSDNDGLSDREEVKVYKTDPLNPDTDSDGYLDGAEVKAGYNPNGTGKLLPSNF
ncbi:MAG: hypothetical protein NTZ18_01040 [Candidatus Komeilibacteria bacterium]|nr:hypothetical protein [Candidatus Komeilibacteria bacterium]